VISRRRFLAGSAGLAVAATACTGDDDASNDDPDRALATTAARMERVVVDTYTGLRATAVQGRLGAAIPQAFVEFLTAATGHHQEHLRAWDPSLTSAPDADLRQAVDRAVVGMADIPAAVSLALRIEDYASRTYLQALPTLRSEDVVRTAGQILVVDQQHQAVLRHILGLAPAGRDFAPADPGLAILSTR
jgi:hypothetical protein